uniref:Syndecan n=1 Tax=Denticeps clupeoides TaxID=299321 RepID=A0AAY4C9E6_9TELE
MHLVIDFFFPLSISCPLVPDLDSGPTSTSVAFTTEEPLPLSTTQATGPAPSAPPAAEPSSRPPPESGRVRDREKDEEEAEDREEESERQREMGEVQEEELEGDTETEGALTVPWAPPTSSVPTAAQPTSAPPSTPPEELSTTELEEEQEEIFFTTQMYPTIPQLTTTDTTPMEEDTPTPDDITTAQPITQAPQTTPPTTPPAARPRKPWATPTLATPSRPSTSTMVTTPTPTPTTQVTIIFTVSFPNKTSETSEDNEVGVATKLPEEDGHLGNEVGRNGGVSDRGVEPDLIGNTVNTGSSAAQLPQKNILERKEVLIAVIVGGVVGAMFAVFLVMLLVYRMKKKDEGSYTLEEPKQATVTYHKPDKQEEFYA